jgi:hypothetical protein
LQGIVANDAADDVGVTQKSEADDQHRPKQCADKIRLHANLTGPQTDRQIRASQDQRERQRGRGPEHHLHGC